MRGCSENGMGRAVPAPFSRKGGAKDVELPVAPKRLFTDATEKAERKGLRPLIMTANGTFSADGQD